MSQSSSPTRNRTLDGLRGFAASLVMARHLAGFLIAPGLLPAFLVQFDPVLDQVGEGGVCLFFMISGYLIVQSLLKLRSVRRFARNRMVRIYPAFLVLHLLYFTVGPLIGYEWMGDLRGDLALWARRFVENLLFLPGVFPLPIAQKNAWSLSYEAAFYLIACIGFAAWRGARARALFASSFWTLVFAVLTARFVALHPRAWFFVAGVLVYFARPYVTGLSIPAFLRQSGPLWLVLMFPTLDAPYLAAVFGMLAFLTFEQEWGGASALLRFPVMQWLGRISYSLYLVHPLVLAVVRQGVVRAAPELQAVSPYAPLACMVIWGVPLSLALAHLSYELIEVRLTDRFLRRAPSRPVTPRQ